MNLDTGDGNRLHWCNFDFWQSATALGGASSDRADALTRDFKDLAVFSDVIATQLLIVVHEEGCPALGWRKWALTTPRTLQGLFALSSGSSTSTNRVATSSTGDYGSLHVSEPMVRNTVSSGPHTDELWINSNIVANDGWNRMTVRKANDRSGYNNYGWGLGTMYDTGSTGGCGTARPMADAEMHTTHVNWGSGGGIGGVIGSDHLCNSGCPWSTISEYHYDYAIYVLAE